MKKQFVEQTIVLDSLSLVPGSLTIYKEGEKLSPTAYSISEIRATVRFNNKINDTLLFQYQVFPYAFGMRYQLRDTSKIFSQQKGD
ncbi:MAG: hypothetical protein ACKO1R_01125, partial [Crocinitomicaceae bacterium]